MSLAESVMSVLFAPISLPSSNFVSSEELSEYMIYKLRRTTTYGIPAPDSVYRVSSLLKICPREEFLRFKNKIPRVETIEPMLTRTFDFGKAFHNLVQQEWLQDVLFGDWYCKRCHELYTNSKKPSACIKCGQFKFEYKELEPFSELLKISGHVDGVIDINGRKSVLEIKTCNSQVFKLVTQIHKRPMDYHVHQIMFYMGLLKIHHGIILYFEKDSSSVYGFDVRYDSAQISHLVKRLEESRSSMLSGKLPDRVICENRSCSRAKSCSVASLCFETK